MVASRDALPPTGAPAQRRLYGTARCPEGTAMRNEFTAIVERDGEWFIAYCPEIPGANGQGRTREESLSSLADAIALILEDRREDALRGIPEDATRETVVLE